MANKYDLKTVFQSVASNASAHVVIADVSTVSAVPTGKTRFLTYLRIERTTPPSATSVITGLTGVIASVATSSNISCYASAVSGGGKLPVKLDGVSFQSCPVSSGYLPDGVFVKENPENGPNMDHPLISVAGGSCMIYHAASGPATMLFAQYYDE